CAAQLQSASGGHVVFLDEGMNLSPDLRVGELAYVECKDLHSASRAGIAPGLRDHLSKASEQTNTANADAPLIGTGICIDVPWGTLPLNAAEWGAIREVLESPQGPTFIYLTCSGVSVTDTTISYPTA